MAANHLPEPRRRIVRMTDKPVVTAAATPLSAAKIGRQWSQAWQDEAWEHYDQVGELRFVANAIAGSMAQASFYVGEINDVSDDVRPVDEGVVADVFQTFGGSQAEREELIRRMGLQLFVAGDGWIVGVPPEVLDDGRYTTDGIPPLGRSLADLRWLVLSVQELSVRQGRIELRLGDRVRTVSEDDAVLIRVWRPHPRAYWEADSPVRSNLPVLRELVGLTKHISANIDSRLAGAGLLILPQSVSVMGGIGQTEDDDPDADPFLNDLMDSMLTPIKDRDAASAVVPLVIKVPDEVAASVGQSNLITFSTPFDERSKELRDEAIRRLALGLDVSPELLLGMGEVNHWSGWLIDEQNAKTHIGPVLGLVCNAITDAYLHPALAEAGVADPSRFRVWYDMTDLTLRPDRSTAARELFDRGVISAESLRMHSGFDDSDAPPAEQDPAIAIALAAGQSAPSLFQNPGLPVLVEQIRAALANAPVPEMPDEIDDIVPDDTGRDLPEMPDVTDTP